MLGVAFLVLVVIILLIVRGCSGKEEEKPQDTEQDNSARRSGHSAPADPDVPPPCRRGDIMPIRARSTPPSRMTSPITSRRLSAVSAYTASADITVGIWGSIAGHHALFRQPHHRALLQSTEILAQNLSDIGFDILQTANTYPYERHQRPLLHHAPAQRGRIDAVGTHTSDPAPTGGVITREVNGIKFAFIAFTSASTTDAAPQLGVLRGSSLYRLQYRLQIVDSTGILERWMPPRPPIRCHCSHAPLGFGI